VLRLFVIGETAALVVVVAVMHTYPPQMRTHVVVTEFIKYVKIMRHVSAHLELSSGDTLFKSIKY
jgi:hypothetical protein